MAKSYEKWTGQWPNCMSIKIEFEEKNPKVDAFYAMNHLKKTSFEGRVSDGTGDSYVFAYFIPDKSVKRDHEVIVWDVKAPFDEPFKQRALTKIRELVKVILEKEKK